MPCDCCHEHEHEHAAPEGVTEVFVPTFRNDEDRGVYDRARAEPGAQDVTGGKGAIIRQTLQPAPADADVCPEADASVTVHYTGKLADGTVFDSSVTRGTPFTFDIGNGSVIRGWDQGVPGMRVGEKALLTIVSDYAYGKAGSGSIPSDALLQFEVELIDFEEKDHEYPGTNEEKLAAAKVRQELGNKYFKEGKLGKAAAKYDKGTQLLEYFFDPTPELEEERVVLRATLFSNWAIVLFKQEKYADSCGRAREGVKLLEEKEERRTAQRPLLFKLYMRVARGAMHAARYQEAKGFFEMARDLGLGNERNGEAEKELARCETRIAAEERQKAGLYRRMMSGISG